MALNIGDKVYRNMQEQVGYLTKLVDELKEIIKEKEYAIKEIDIVDGELIFTFNDGSEIDAGEVKSITSLSFDAQKHLILVYNTGDEVDLGQVKGLTSISLNASKHMIVTYDDGTTADLGLMKSLDHFELDSSYHLWVYYDNNTSEDLGAVISGTIDFTTLDLVAKTLSQINPNYSDNIALNSRNANLTPSSVYSVIKEINNVLYLVINVDLTCTASTTTGTGILLNSTSDNITLPNSIASKIYDFNGNNCVGAGNNTIICADSARMTKHKDGNDYIPMKEGTFVLLNTNYTRGVKISVGCQESISLTTGEHLYVTGRMALTLL